MIEIKCPEHFRDVVAFAAKVGALDQFMGRVLYLGAYALQSRNIADVKAELFRDDAPHSFAFVIYAAKKPLHRGGAWERWFNGGLIYSGPGQPLDGSAPAFTVGIGTDPAVHSWSVHT